MAIIGALPTILTNGTTADATQVMADFNFIVAQVNANAANAGANSNITSLQSMTTPLSTTFGGTGASSAGVALDNVGGFSLPGIPSRLGSGTYSLVELPVGVKQGRMYVAANGNSGAYSAEQVTLITGVGASGAQVTLNAFSASASLGVVGIGGMDTGSAPSNGFLSIYAASGSSGSGMFACNHSNSGGAAYTGANLPAGFSYTSLLGIWPTTASAQFIAGAVIDRMFNFQTPVTIFTGTSIPATLTAQSVSSAAPSATRYVSGILANTATTASGFQIAADGSGLALQRSPVWTGIGNFTPLFTFLNIPLVSTTTVFLADNQGAAVSSLTITAYGF